MQYLKLILYLCYIFLAGTLIIPCLTVRLTVTYNFSATTYLYTFSFSLSLSVFFPLYFLYLCLQEGPTFLNLLFFTLLTLRSGLICLLKLSYPYLKQRVQIVPLYRPPFNLQNYFNN